jgi:hypothetical protein
LMSAKLFLYLHINQYVMNIKKPYKMKTVLLSGTAKEYIQSVLSKSASNTVNSLISHFRENNLSTSIDFVRKLEIEQQTGFNLEIQNVDFIDSIKRGSFSFTVNCLILTAKELGIKP